MWYDIANIVHQAAEIFRNFVGVVAGVDSNNVVRVLKTTNAGEVVTEEVAASSPTSYTVSLVNANQQYSQVLPAGTRYFSMQPRQTRTVRFAFVDGKVAGPVDPYGSMKSGAPYTSPKLLLPAALTVYFAAGQPNTHVEIVVWS